MKCFYHHNFDAVGSCKSCGKGLCPECAVDLGKGLACRNQCEEEAKRVINLIEQNIKISPRAAEICAQNRRNIAGPGVFNLVMGGIFLAWGLTDRDRFTFLIFLGASFLVFGAIPFLRCKPD